MSTLALNAHTPVDATAGAVAMALPSSASNGDEVSCEKYDTTTNAITITGNIRGTANSTITLSLAKETVGFRARVVNSTTSWWPIYGHKTLSSLDGRYTAAAQTVLGWAVAGAYTLTTVTRDANAAITTASVKWPDGTVGTFTTDAASTLFPGAIDGYHVTYGTSPVIHTYTQPTMTRDASTGAVTAQPALVVT